MEGERGTEQFPDRRDLGLLNSVKRVSYRNVNYEKHNSMEGVSYEKGFIVRDIKQTQESYVKKT